MASKKPASAKAKQASVASKPAKSKSVALKPAKPKTAASKPKGSPANAVVKKSAKKPTVTKTSTKGSAAKATQKPTVPVSKKSGPTPSKAKPPLKKPEPLKLTPFLEKQRQRLLTLKDTLLDSMSGVARDSLRQEGEASAFGMHQADAGSDAYDRDFALSLLSQEQDSLYEIDQALKRIEQGAYGSCEMSGKPIPRVRLEALPFTRYTVECQAEIEKRNRYTKYRQPVTSLFGLTDEESDGEEEETPVDTKD